MQKAESDREYKTMTIPCKVCGKEFELRLPIHYYETMLAIAEQEGEALEFAATCPDCRKDNPLLRLMDQIPGVMTSRDFARSKQ